MVANQQVTVTFPLSVDIYDPSLVRIAGQSELGNSSSTEDVVKTFFETLLSDAQVSFPQCVATVSVVSDIPSSTSARRQSVPSDELGPSPSLKLSGNSAALSAIECSKEEKERTKAYVASDVSPHQLIHLLFSITGSPAHVSGMRSIILRHNPAQIAVLIKASNRAMLISASRELKPIVRDRFQQIKTETNTQITILGQHYLNDPFKVLPPPGLGSAADNAIDIEIVGSWEAVQIARIEVLVALDKFSGLSACCVAVDPKLQPLLAGIEKSFVKSVMEQTITNVYLPTPLSGSQVLSKSVENSGQHYRHALVHITGTEEGVQRAKVTLNAKIEELKAKFCCKSVQCLPRKTEWLLLHCKEELVRIMKSNAVYVALPIIGSQSNLIHFYGAANNQVERAVKSVMQLLLDLYISCIQMSAPLQAQHFAKECTEASQISGTEILLKSQYLEIYGLESNTTKAYKWLTSLPALSRLVRDTKFQIELGLDQKEFLEGKKMGKINKITTTSECKIAFHENYNEFNMLIDVIHPIPSHALQGLALLQAELPAEISFCIPEANHKRIIGISGKNIQKIMKKFGVYVKFSNNEEHQRIGGYYENEDNVIARTPAKNAAQLQGFKEAIMELNFSLQRRSVDEFVQIPRDFHLFIRGVSVNRLQHIIKVTNTEIAFPDCESGSQTVRIHGSESGVKMAKAMLLELVPQVSEILVHASESAQKTLKSPSFTENVVERLRSLNVSVQVSALGYGGEQREAEPQKPILSDSPTTSPKMESAISDSFSIYLFYYPNSSKVAEAKEVVMGYLGSQRIVPLVSGSIASPVRNSGDQSNFHSPVKASSSVANINGLHHSVSNDTIRSSASCDSFAHFNSRVLAPMTSAKVGANPDDGVSLLSSSLPTGAGSNFFQGQPDSQFASSLHKTTIPMSSSLKAIRDIFQAPPSALQLLAGSPEVSPKTSPKPSSAANGNVVNPSPLGQGSSVIRGVRGQTVGEGRPYSVSQQVQQQAFGHDSNVSAVFGTFSSRRPSVSGWHEGILPTATATDAPESSSIKNLNLDHVSRALKTSGDFSSLGGASGMEDQSLAILTLENVRAIMAVSCERQVSVLLQLLSLEKYQSLFEEEEVDLVTLQSFTEQDLKDLGVGAFGARRKLVLAILDLKQSKQVLPSQLDLGDRVFDSKMPEAVEKSRRRSNSVATKSGTSRPTPAPNVRM